VKNLLLSKPRCVKATKKELAITVPNAFSLTTSQSLEALRTSTRPLYVLASNKPENAKKLPTNVGMLMDMMS